MRLILPVLMCLSLVLRSVVLFTYRYSKRKNRFDLLARGTAKTTVFKVVQF